MEQTGIARSIRNPASCPASPHLSEPYPVRPHYPPLDRTFTLSLGMKKPPVRHNALLGAFGECGAKGIRTPDLLIANETRYQLRHSPRYRMMLAPLSGPVPTRHSPTALGLWTSSSGGSQSAGAARRGATGRSAGVSAVGMMMVLSTGADRSMVRTLRGTRGLET